MDIISQLIFIKFDIAYHNRDYTEFRLLTIYATSSLIIELAIERHSRHAHVAFAIAAPPRQVIPLILLAPASPPPRAHS
jgi:hypothetical protein